MRRFSSTLVALAVLAVGAVDAAAQAPAPPASTAPAFVIQSDNGDNRLQLGAIVQADARFALDDGRGGVTDAFNLRRLRSVVQGRVARHFEYFLNVDFAGNAVNVRDAYLDTVFAPAFKLRLGKMKAPFSYDRNILVVNLSFVERGLTTSVAPDRDAGVQIFGDVAGNTLSYAVALTNGVVDGGSADTDVNDAKDVTGRLVVRPFAKARQHPLSGLGVAVAGSSGTQGGGLPSFQSSGRQTFFAYAGATGDGRRTRLSPQAFYYRGPFGAYGEYVRSRGGVAKGGTTGEVDHEAWQVAASWVLTGEPAPPERNPRPAVSFDPPSRHFGALQVAARLQRLSVSESAATRGLLAANASRSASVRAIGLNWYLNPFVKWNLNLERTVFDGGADGTRPGETMVLVRTQLAF